MSKKVKHIHKLRRHTYTSGNQIYFCTLPDCNFKSESTFLIGKEVLCNRCGNPFIMNQYAMRLVKPHCPDCHNNNRRTGHGGDRRIIPTRREIDPTILPQVAESPIEDLRARLEGNTKDEILANPSFRKLFEDDEDDSSELL